MKLWPFSRSGVKTFNEARKQWRWCSIGRRRHLSRRSIPGGSHADVSLMHEPLEVRKLLAISAGYDGNDLAITADAEGDAITLEFDGSIVKIYDASGLYDTYTTSGFSGNITASSTDANLNTSFTFAFDQTALSRALQIDASISSTAIGSAIESTSSADISFGGLTTIAADISTPASINFGGDVVIFDDITLTATDVIVSGNVEAAVSAFGMDDIGIRWQETTAATTSSTALVTPADGSPQVWAATVGFSSGIERFDPANGSSLGSLGYDVGTSGHGNFNLIPCPTGEYVYGVHYTPYTSGGGGYQNPGRIFQYATDGSGYATFYLGEFEYDYRGHQCLTIADDGSYILLSQGEKIFKIDTSTAWAGASDNQDRIQHTWEFSDSKDFGNPAISEQLRINAITILPDGSRAYGALHYVNVGNDSNINEKREMNAFAVLDLQTLGQPNFTTLSGVPSVGNNIHPYWVNAAPDSSGVYGANTHGGLDLVWRVPVSGPQTHLPVDDWTTTPDQHGPYTNAVLSGNGSRYFTTYNSGNGTYFKVHDTTGGTIAKIAYTYIYIDGIDTNAPPRKSTTAPGNKPHGYNQPSLVVSNDGSYGALATTNNEVVILDWSDTDSPILVDRVQVDHTISSIELVETDTSSAIYVGGSNKVTKIFIAGDPEDGKLPPLPETSTLVVNASNLSHFGGSIGATNPLTGLVTDAPGVTVLSGNVTTTGDHTFLDPVQLQADVDLLGTGFSALEAGATGSFHLNAFADSGTRIEGVSNLSSFTTNTTITVNGTINTTGQQQYDDGIQLLGATTLGGGSAILAGAIDGNNENLTLNFSAETAINNPGDSNRIANFVSNGPIALQGTISTTGSQTYGSTLTLADDATIVAQSTNLTGGIAGNQKNLTLNVQNETLIDGTSVFDNLASIESTGPVRLNATVVTSGNQNYRGTVTLVGDTTLVADAGEFSREIIGNGQDLTLNINNTITIADGSGVNNLTSIGETVLTGTINTTGSQTYQSNVTIEGDVTIDAGGEVVFEADIIGDDEIIYSSWATQAGGISNDYGYDVSVLADGSSIVTGYFQGTATFGSTTFTSAGNYDVFVAKLDASGDYEWATQAGGTGNDYGYGVSVLADGSSIVTGDFYGTATFGSTTFTSAGTYDVFVAKLDASGNYEWATQAGGTGHDNARGVSVLADGSSIVTGMFQGTATFGSTTFTSAGNSDVFVAKLDASGDYEWAERAGGTENDYGYGVSVLADGSSIVMGYFKGTATFGSTTFTSAGSNDVFVAKLDASGDYEWATQAGGTGSEEARGVSVLADGSSIVTGLFEGTATFGSTTFTSAGNYDVFVAKLDASGDYEWAERAGGTGNESGYGVSVLADGSSIVTGYFQGTATFGSTTFTSAGSNDVFVAKLDASGDYEWATQAGGTGNDVGFASVLADGSSIVTGRFYGIATFGSTTLTSAGSYDVFVAKLDANGSFDSVVIPDDADLIINTQANTTFGGTVSNLATLTTDAGGSTIAKADITTTGNQTYNDQFVLNTSLTLTGGDASFTAGIDGDGNDLTLNFTGNATLDGGATPISGINNLTSLGGVATNGTITTTGAQSFEGNATLIGNTTLVGPSATLAGTFDGQGHDLTINYTSPTTISSSGGNISNFTSVGDVLLNTTDFETIGSQTFQGNVTLTGDTMLTGTSGSFENGLDGDGHSLTLNYFNTTTIDGNSVFSDLNDLTSHGPVELGGTIQTAGNQSYLGTATLINATEIQAAGGSFEGGLVGAGNDLTLNIANTITIADGSGVNNLTSIGETILTGTINTTGSQTYQSDVTIEGDVTIDAGGEVVFEADIIGDDEIIYSSWATQAGGTGNDYGYDVSVLADGSSIVTGYFQGTATFGSTTLTSAGNYDVFVAKLDASGDYEWATQAGGTNSDYGYGVSVLADGSSIVTGDFYGTATFGSTTFTSAGNYDVFVAKLDASGDYEWATQAGGTGNDYARGVSVLADGSSIVTGDFYGTATFGSTTFTSAGNSDVFVAKLDASGDYEWAERAGGTGNDNARGVSVLADGSSIVTGYFQGTATFGSTTFTSAGSNDVFVAKLDASGDYEWATQAGGTGSEEARGVSVLADGSSIVTGYFKDTATFGSTTFTSAGNYDVFVAKLDASGDYEWATQAGGTGNDNARGVSVLADGSSIVTGYFQGTATFGSTTFTSAGSNDVFVAKLDASGDYEWATQAGGTGNDVGFASVLADGSSIVTGYFEGTATFGSTTFTSAGSRDVFVAKLDANGSFDSVVISDDPDLTINTQANTTFGGTVSDLATLTTDAGGSTIAKADITTTGNQTYNDEFVLNTSLTLTGGDASFTAGIDGDGNDLTLNFTGNATLDGGATPISGINNLTSLGGVATNGTITTTGAQSFEGNATLIGNTTLVGPSATLAGTFDGQGHDLTINYTSPTTISSSGGNISNFTSVGDVLLNTTDFETIGSQTFQGNVTLTGDTMLTGTIGSFANGLDGDGHSLTLNYFNTTTIDGNSVFSDLNDLTSHGPVELGGTVQTAGNQSYLGTATLINATEIQAAGGSFEGGLVGAGNDLTLNIANTITIADGSGVNNLTSIGETILTGTINTTGSQTYQSDVTIEGDVTINAGGEVVFEADIIGDDEIIYSSWATQAGGTNSASGDGVSVLADGSSIVTGNFRDTATFGSTTLTSAGNYDVFVAKIDASGTYEWATQAGGTNSNYGYGVSVLADGSSIVTGIFQGTATFGSTTFTSAGNYDVFVAKIDASGTYEWATQAGGTSSDTGYGVSVLADGSSIVTGFFEGTATFGSTTLTSAGVNEAFVAKLDASGTYEWAERAGGTGNDNARDVSVLADGSSIVTGYFRDTATFGSTTLTSAGSDDVFVAKIDASGTYEWAKQAGGTSNDSGYGVSVLADGSSIVTGIFQGTATFGSTTLTSVGSNDVFVAKLDASGTYEWVKQAGGTRNDNARGVSVLADGSSIVTGFFEDTATFGNTTLTSAGASDVFVTKLDANGSYEWATQAGGMTSDNGYGVSVLADGSSIVTGYFQGTATFGSTTLTSAGSKDMFVVRLDASGNFDGIVIPDDADLIINTQANTTFGGTVSNLATLTTDAGGSTIAKADITTTGNQTYNDQFVLNTSLTLTGGDASFTGGIDGDGNDLTLNFTGNATLDGGATPISGINNLTSLGGVAANGTIATSAQQNYSGPVTLLGSSTFQGTTGTFTGGLDGNTNDLTLDFSSGTTIDGNSVFSNLGNLTSKGPTALNGTIVTNGSQTYEDAVELLGATNLQGTGGTFTGGLDGKSNDLTLNFSDVTTIDGSTVFSNLGNLTSVGAVELNGTINTTGSQDYQNSVTLQGDTKLEGTSGTSNGSLDGGNNSLTLDFSELTTINGSSGVTNLQNLTSVGDVALGGLIVTSGSQEYQQNISLISNTTLQGSAGILGGSFDGGSHDFTMNFASTTTIGGGISNVADFTSVGAVDVTSDIATTGSQDYQSLVSLNASATFTGTSGIFTGGLDGNGNDLTLNFSSATTIDGNNDFSDLGSLRSIGDVNLNGTIVTANVQTYEANMTLIGTTVLQGQQGVINGSLIGDSNDLTLNFTTETAIAGDGNGINNLTVVGPALLGASVTTIGSQEYQSPVTLSDATVLTGTNGTFTGALNGNENDLTLDFSDTTTIDGNNVFSNLGNFTSHGDVNLTGTIVTKNVQTYEANMTLIGPTVLQGEQGVINGSLTGNGNDLTLDFTTETAIAGDGNGINNLTVVGPALLGASVTTIGSQEYQSPVTLSAATVLTGTSGTFAGGLDGNENDLTLNFSNVTTIDGSSTFWHLDNLVSKGDVVLNSTISTSGSQTYEQNVSLSGATILVGQNGTFGGPIAGNNNDLTLNFGDTTTITGSQLQDIHNLIVGGGGSIETSGVVSTTGSQQYLDDIVLTGDTTLLSGSATISTQAITDNAANHTLTLGDAGQTGDIVLDGNISIGSLVVGASSFNISITGTDNTFNGTADFKNSGTISLGDEETDTTLFALGLNTTAGSSTNTGGNIRTRGADVVINQINQLANTTIDTTAGNNPSGAQIRLLDGVELNGQELTTDGGTSGSTRVAGNSTIDDGKVIVEEGDLDIGEETLPGNLTLTRDTIFRMDGGGSINIKPNSSIAAANHSLTMVTNVLNIDPDAGDVTASNITITPQNKSLDVFLGTSIGGGLDVGQESFDHLKSQNIVIGETGFTGTITVGNLTVSTGQLTLIADGTGGAINISEGLNLTDSKDGLSLYIRGSGATTDLNGTIQTAGAAYIEDAIRLIGDASIETTGGDITITGGTEGIFSQAGSNFNLSIDAGTGTVALGSLAGFGNGNGTGSLLQDASVTGASIELFATSDSVAGNLSFNGPVSIVGPTPRSLTMSAGNINFLSTVDANSGDFSDLILNSQGTTSFSGSIGATHQLGSLTTDAGGTTNINGGSVNTVGSQSFGDAVVLGSDATLTSLNSDIVFTSTVDSDSTARTLALSAGGNISFNSAVGSLSKLASLTLAQAFAVEAQSTVAIDGTGRNLDGLLIESGVNNVTMTQAGSTIESAGKVSVRFAGGSANTQIAGFTVTDGDGTGLAAGPGSYANSSVTASSFTVKSGTGFAVDLNSAQGLTVGGTGTAANTFKNSIYGGGAAGDLSGTSVVGNAFEDVIIGFRLNDAENFSLSGANTFDSYSATPLGTSVRPEGSITTAPSQPTYGPAARTGLYAIGESNGTVVAGNKFENGSGGLTLAEVRNLTINGNNTIEVFDDTGITVYGDVTGTTIENNTIVGNTSAPNTVGLRLVDAQNLSASNNTFSEVTTGVLADGDLSGTVLSDNTFDGANGTTGVRITGSNLKLERNTIRNFTGNGIEVDGATAINNAFLENSIYDNGGKGISLLNGGNGNQAAPTITSTTKVDDDIVIDGTLTTPAGDYRIEVFRNLSFDVAGSPNDPSSLQGRIFIGSEEVFLAGGSNALSISLPLAGIDAGDWITMTATSLSGSQPQNTSEFSDGAMMSGGGRSILAVGSGGSWSYGLQNRPAARLYDINALENDDILDPLNAPSGQLLNQAVTETPDMHADHAGTGPANLSSVYGETFATTWYGGLTVTHTDLDGDGYEDIVTAPGPLPAHTTNTFGDSLRKIGFFNGNPSGSWVYESIDVSDLFGADYTGGFNLTAGNVLPYDAEQNPLLTEQVIVSSSSPTGTFNGAVVFTLASTTVRGTPSQTVVPIKTPAVSGTITDITTGRFSNNDDEASIVLATTTGSQTTVSVFGLDENAEQNTFVSEANFTLSLNLPQANGVATDIFAQGTSMSAGDLNGDDIDELVVAAGASGMGNFRVLEGHAVLGGIQADINAMLNMSLGDFGTGAMDGRYSAYADGSQNPQQVQSNLDYFYGTPVAGFTGQGFNSQMEVTLTDSDGDLTYEVFIAIRGVNSSGNTIKHFAFSDDINPTARWTIRQGLQAVGLTSESFEDGEGLWLG